MNRMTVLPLHTGTIAASGSKTFDAIDLSKLSNEHRLSLQITATGDGTATVDILASNDNTDYVDTETDVLAGVVKTGGPGSDGKYKPILITTAMLPYCRWFKVRVTETGTANSITLAMTLMVQ